MVFLPQSYICLSPILLCIHSHYVTDLNAQRQSDISLRMHSVYNDSYIAHYFTKFT